MAKRDPDFQAAEVMAEVLEEESFDGPVLIMGEPTGTLASMIEAGATQWIRRAGTPTTATPFPPAQPFGTILVRMTRSVDELMFTMALAAANLAPGSRLYLFGTNDEGIRSAAKGFETFYAAPETLLTKRHCRVFGARRNDVAALPGPDDFLEMVEVETRSHHLTWRSLPGMFAHGRLDAGSELLIENLPELTRGARVLDYGAGAGVLSLAMRSSDPGLQVTLLDNDALALQIAAQNVEGAEAVCATSLGPLEGERFDLILSNPPIHIGKKQTYTVLERLIADAPEHLVPGGALRLVVQGTAPVERMMAGAFKTVRAIADNRSFVVWEGRV